jgi:signal transduction histidine kinase
MSEMTLGSCLSLRWGTRTERLLTLARLGGIAALLWIAANELVAERVRADAERDRAAALAERNRLGREMHDVLAHSLGALSVQLDAADALLQAGDDPDKARELVQTARGLAVQGLDETRQAVHALRDAPVGLAAELKVLGRDVQPPPSPSGWTVELAVPR